MQKILIQKFFLENKILFFENVGVKGKKNKIIIVVIIIILFERLYFIEESITYTTIEKIKIFNDYKIDCRESY